MKKLLNIIILLFILLNTNAQNIGSFVVSTGGNQVNSNNIYYSYTIGEISAPFTQNNYVLTSGFEQPINIKAKQTKKDTLLSDYEIKIYPNPTADIINFNITSRYEIQDININIYNILGEQLFVPTKKLIYENFYSVKIDLSNCQAGYYFVKLQFNNNYSYTYKIIRK